MGPENSATSTALMDAVEALMREEGYAALSARNIARRAGLKYQIVFYYFETMDDLLLATYRRRTAQVLKQMEDALQSKRPLHALWAAWTDPADGALSMEYMALANHNAAIRDETIAFGEQIRRLQLKNLGSRLKEAKLDPKVFKPLAVTTLMTSLGGILGFETALGITGGHKEIESIVKWCLQQLEPGSSSG